MAVGDTHVVHGFLTLGLIEFSFQSHRLLFLTCFSRGERRKYAGKEVRLNRVSVNHWSGRGKFDKKMQFNKTKKQKKIKVKGR